MFNVTLVEPEIPNNTGNIGRTCVATGCSLHLIEPLGFAIDDKQLKRAGLDYWVHLNWTKYQSYNDFNSIRKENRKIFFTAHASKSYYDFEFQPDDYLIFGKETKGLDPEIIAENKDSCLFIPTTDKVRSLNLATSVAVVVYEAIRQVREKTQSR
ncbi:MAG: tRNA (cytidine(34)-2'-O)-methyltransferase [Bdellovibrionaceae bacterium]|nr:tRNA (cytidine(34)-2'-O)-methyltransferase [Pseudobdellovibrionaceae bacterium]